MGIFQALRIGIRQVNQTRRMIVFAWLVNVTLSLTIAVPFLSQVESAVRGTVMEERLLEQMDSNWFQSFRLDNQSNPIVLPFDYTIFGYAPFLLHYESVLSGTMIKNIGNFFLDLIFRWRVGFEYLGPLTILAFVYLLASTFLAGAFVGTYAKSYRMSFQEFLTEGGKYFGKFFRISLFSLFVYLLLFDVVFDFWREWIRQATANDPSEMTPFTHYMIKNAVVVLAIGFLTMCFDYAKVRMVVDDRFSALFAVWAGVKFVVKNFWSAAGLFLSLSVLGVVFMALYAFFQGTFPVSGYWSILALFVLQQLYVGIRLWLKAAFYASETQLYQSLMQTDHRTEVAQ
ncbi:MAG: hypothetical protein WEB33_07285 [Bacteroidota bacterium]